MRTAGQGGTEQSVRSAGRAGDVQQEAEQSLRPGSKRQRPRL